MRVVLSALFGTDLNDKVLGKLKFKQVDFFYKVLAFTFKNMKILEDGYSIFHFDFEKHNISIEEIEAIDWEPILK